jgi:hypothetical protein
MWQFLKNVRLPPTFPAKSEVLQLARMTNIIIPSYIQCRLNATWRQTSPGYSKQGIPLQNAVFNRKRYTPSFLTWAKITVLKKKKNNI